MYIGQNLVRNIQITMIVLSTQKLIHYNQRLTFYYCFYILCVLFDRTNPILESSIPVWASQYAFYFTWVLFIGKFVCKKANWLLALWQVLFMWFAQVRLEKSSASRQVALPY